MSYIEIMQALENDFKVFWINKAYKVFLQNSELYVIFIYNDYMNKLDESEYIECFKETIAEC